MPDFVHLHNHTHYSLLDALSTSEGLIKYAIANNQKAIALTDHGVMYGCLDFYKKAKSYGIKPILGVEAYMANGDRHDKENKRNLKKKNYYHLVLLAKNLTGYKNLMKLVSAGFTEGFYYKPRIDRELLEKYHEGIICLSACLGGVVASHLIDSDIEEAYNSAKYYKELFGDDFYLEIQNHNLEEDPIVLDLVPKMARELNIKLVATNDIHYLEKSHAVAHNVLLMIQSSSSTNKTENDIYNLRYKQSEFYFKSSEEMYELFKEFPDALTNTVEIADKCNLELDLKTNYMPMFPIPSESKAANLDEYLEELVYAGLTERYSEITDVIKERADYEISVVNKMGFPGYFLIVWDFIKAARERGVSVGPGRGSAAGSIIAYALKITNVDPLKYNLLFERFLNPERVSMPDIDVDFADDKRDIVLEYVKEKYGENAVSMISTFSKLAPKAALTDVGRVLGVDLAFIKSITKKIPVKFGKVTPLKEALELPELVAFKNDKSELTQNLINFSLLLEDKLRGLGTHAAGVVIAPGDVSDYVPVCVSGSTRDQAIKLNTQYTMKDLEDAGLLKMDFLGLRTLSIIENTLDMIELNHGIRIDVDVDIDYDDKKTYDLIGSGDTLGIFQFESGGMQEYLRKLKPENLEELTAMNALYRPGPMENIPEFINRKFGRSEISYLHDLMKKSLHTTYGIIVYQEQVMQLVQDLANFGLGEADLMRRAMGKKDMKIMAEQKVNFANGAKANGIDAKLAEEIFDLIVKFANYGFNKSHSLAYSYLAFQTAWLKTHYTAEFLAANMTAEMHSQATLVELKDEAKKFGIKVVPPDVNVSIANFFASDNIIYYGLAGIKNVGENAVESIISARKEKVFENYFDFVSRVDTRLINKRSLEMLICAGAFDTLKAGHRAQLLEVTDDALNWAKSVSNASASAMDSLFLGEASQEISYPKLPDIPAWSEQERLRLEKEVMNFYVSGHPLLQYEAYINSFTNFDISKIATMQKLPETVRIVGMITDVKSRLNAKGNAFAITSFEDIKGKAECIFWNDTWKKYAPIVENNGVYIIKGKLNNDADDLKIAKIVVTELITIEEATQNGIKGLKLWLDIDDSEVNHKIQQLYELTNQIYGKKSSIIFNLFDKSKDYKSVLYADDLKFEINSNIILKISDIFGSHNLKFLLN